MTCSENSCGTGIGTVILPGDPSNESIVTAASAFGGVEVSWTMPTTNPFAVAYTEVYRSYVNNFNSALMIASASGDRYFDRFDWSTGIAATMYYWVVFVSVNGTKGEPLGPGSAVPRATIDQIITELTAKIDYGMLSVNLKTQVDKVDLLTQSQNTINQALGNEQATIRDLLVTLQSSVDDTTVLISAETAARQDGESALLTSINTFGAQSEAALAAVVQEQTARIAADNALSQNLTTVQSSLGNSIASVQTNLQTNITSVGNKTNAIGALYTAKVTVDSNGTKLIGGFGIYNDGSTIEAGFDVNRFWIGSTGNNKKRPFIVSGSEVFIDQAVIQNASIALAKINTATISSLSALNANMGTLTAGKILFLEAGGTGSYLSIDAAVQCLSVYNNGLLRVRIGRLT